MGKSRHCGGMNASETRSCPSACLIQVSRVGTYLRTFGLRHRTEEYTYLSTNARGDYNMYYNNVVLNCIDSVWGEVTLRLVGDTAHEVLKKRSAFFGRDTRLLLRTRMRA